MTMRIGGQENVTGMNATPVRFCGVYAIVNGATKRAYIGSSASVAARFSTHKRYLNDHLREGLSHANSELQADWDIYGEDMFDWVLLEACPPELLLGREQAWMDFIGPDYLYNQKKASDPNRVIEAELAADIRELKESGHTNREIALLLNISERQIHNVVTAAYNGREDISPKKPNRWENGSRIQ